MRASSPMPFFEPPLRMSRGILGLLLCCLLGLPLQAKLSVVSLHPVLGEFAERLGGDEVSVFEAVPSGMDFHSYSPTPTDVRALRRADLVLANGFGLEPWLDKLVRNSGTRGRIIEASALITKPLEVCEGEGHDHAAHGHHHHDHGDQDPHWWHSLQEARSVVRGLCRTLCELDPEHTSNFQTRLASMEASFASLEAWVRDQLAVLPVENRQLVTSHDAFAYLARDWSFTVYPLVGVNPSAEVDPRGLASLVEWIRKNRIPAIFTDNTENPRVMAAMVRETGAKLGGTLLAGGPSEEGGIAPNYEAMYRHNITLLIEGLRPKQRP